MLVYKLILIKSNLNLIKIIKSPINIQGIIIKTAARTLELIIVYGFTGKLFNMLKDFPSNEIIELVIEDISDEKQTNPNKITIYPRVLYSFFPDKNMFMYNVILSIIHELYHTDQIIDYDLMTKDPIYNIFYERS